MVNRLAKKTMILLACFVAFEACAQKPQAVIPQPTKSADSSLSISTPDLSKPAPTSPVTVSSLPASEVITKPTVVLDTPTQIIEKYTKELKGVVEIKDASKKGVKDQSRESEIATKVRQFFDFQELALQSLGKSNLKKFSPAKQKEFSKLFTSLVEANYLKRSRSLMGDYKVLIQGEKINGAIATVNSKIVRSDTQKSDVDLNITYELQKKEDAWMIYNIIFDEVNLKNNYQSQFNKVIASGGPDKLIKLMKDRIKQAGKEDLKI